MDAIQCCHQTLSGWRSGACEFDQAAERCPIFPGRGRVVHLVFDDPPKLAQNARGREETLALYRRVRDETGAFIETLPEGLED